MWQSRGFNLSNKSWSLFSLTKYDNGMVRNIAVICAQLKLHHRNFKVEITSSFTKSNYFNCLGILKGHHTLNINDIAGISWSL